MQRWLEPPIQNKASFQEAGLIRGGVVENMAPLGTLPKAAMQKKSPLNGDPFPPPVKTRIVLKKPYIATTTTAPEKAPRVRDASPNEEMNTEMDTTADVDATPLSPLSQPLLPTVLPLDDGADDDYVPQNPKSRPLNTSVSISVTPNNTRRHSVRRRSARPSPTPMSSPIHPPSPPRFHPPPSTLNREPDKDLADKVVEAAVDEALRHYRYPTAWALRLLYDEHSSDPHFVSMIEDIYYQRADPDTLKEFNKLVCDKKKEGKVDNKGCYYFVPPSTGSGFTPHKPKTAPYEDMIKLDLSVFHDTPADDHVSKKIKLDNDSIVNGNSSPVKINGANVNSQKGGTTSKSPSKGKKMRTGSVSSSSTLSSVPDDVPDDYEEYMDQVDDDLGVARPSSSPHPRINPTPMAAEPNNAQIPADSTQPISNQKQKPAAKKKNASLKHPSSQNTPRHNLPTRDSSMPSAISHPTTRNKQQAASTGLKSSLKFDSRFGDLDETDELTQKKLAKRLETISLTKDSTENSFIREPSHLEDQDLSFELAVPPPPPVVEQNRLSRTPALSTRAARAAKRHNEDVDESISPIALSFKADLEPPSSTRNSRAATPANLRSTKKPRAGLRVKNSPMKKKGTSAGIPRSNGERPSPIGNSLAHNSDENDDCCYTCGGNGEIVCCDGCHYSFHFLCIDPPMDGERMPDEWYCNECKHNYYPPFGKNEGIFASLLDTLDRKNPRSFRLPEDVREQFEGVRTGPDGEYEEIAPPKPKSNKKGAEEPFDFYRVRNADSPVLCHHCKKGASESRMIIPCSVCGLHWHLECVDPPLAIPPVLRTWRCPCHPEDMLEQTLAPAHRHRKIKDVPAIEQGYSRGLPNNGFIEVDNDDSNDESEHGWGRHVNYGRVQRVSEKGIKLDFIQRVRQNRKYRQSSHPYGQRPAQAGATRPTPTPLKAATLEEQQVALNLAQLSRNQGDGMSQLHQALISNASPAMVSMMAMGDAERIASGKLATVDVASLRAMLTQVECLTQGIREVLQSKTAHTPETVAGSETPKATRFDARLPNVIPEDDNMTIVEDDKSSTVGNSASHDSEAGSGKPDDSSAMEVD